MHANCQPAAPLCTAPHWVQVRHYYYRLIKRLNKILGGESKLDIKNSLQVHRSMLKFYEVVGAAAPAALLHNRPCGFLHSMPEWLPLHAG